MFDSNSNDVVMFYYYQNIYHQVLRRWMVLHHVNLLISYLQVLHIYMQIRVLVSSYLFLSGYGNFYYFFMKGDFSFYRFCKVRSWAELIRTDYVFVFERVFTPDFVQFYRILRVSVANSFLYIFHGLLWKFLDNFFPSIPDCLCALHLKISWVFQIIFLNVWKLRGKWSKRISYMILVYDLCRFSTVWWMLKKWKI